VDERLEDFIKNRVTNADQVFYVGQRDGELVIPDAKVMQAHSTALSGVVNVFRMEDLENL
jgi:hypothetical protein